MISLPVLLQLLLSVGSIITCKFYFVSSASPHILTDQQLAETCRHVKIRAISLFDIPADSFVVPVHLAVLASLVAFGLGIFAGPFVDLCFAARLKWASWIQCVTSPTVVETPAPEEPVTAVRKRPASLPGLYKLSLH